MNTKVLLILGIIIAGATGGILTMTGLVSTAPAPTENLTFSAPYVGSYYIWFEQITNTGNTPVTLTHAELNGMSGRFRDQWGTYYDQVTISPHQTVSMNVVVQPSSGVLVVSSENQSWSFQL